MCSSTETRATVRPTGFHQNDVAGFPRPTRHNSWPPAVKFAPCEPYVESEGRQRFEADATFTHIELRKSPREARSRTLTFLAAGVIAQRVMKRHFLIAIGLA